jgi:hypothetical protein
MSERGTPSRELAAREDNSKWKGRLTFLAGGTGGGGPSHEEQKSKDKKLSKSKRDAQEEFQKIVLAEIRKMRVVLPGVFDDAQLNLFSHLQKDHEGTRTLLHNIFQRFLDEIKKPLSQEQSLSRVRHDTETLVDSTDSDPRSYLSNVDDITFEEHQNLLKNNEELRKENAQFSAERNDALKRVAELDNKLGLAVKEAVEHEKIVAQNQRIRLKDQIEAEAQRKVENDIEKLQNLLTLERRNVLKEKSDKAKDRREYTASQEKLEQQHKRTVDDLKNEHAKELQWTQQDFQKSLKEGRQDLEEQLKSMEEDRVTAIEDIEQNFALERSKWDQNKSRLIQKHHDEMDELSERLSQELHHEKAILLEKLEQANDTNEKLTAKHREKINRLRDDALAERQQLESQVQEQKDALEKERAELLDQVAKTEARLKQEAEDAEAVLKKKYEKMFAEVGERHEQEKEQIRKDRDAYSAALLERDKVRDKIEFLSDVQVTTKFHKLVKEVEELARIEWRSESNLESLLKTLSVQPKTLMRQILQDSIWVVLHEYIFCSPFRIFGEEGKRLQAEWAEKCGEGALVYLVIENWLLLSKVYLPYFDRRLTR